VELPSGRIEGQNIELSVRTKSRLSSPQEFDQLIIKESETNIVRFQDIGTAELSALNEKTLLRRDGILDGCSGFGSPAWIQQY